MTRRLAGKQVRGGFVGQSNKMAFLVCYARNPPEDRTENCAVYLDQTFYEIIFAHCRHLSDACTILRDIGLRSYKFPTLVVTSESLSMLGRELTRLT